MFGPEERRRGGVLRTHEDGVRPSRALGGTYPRRGARPGRRLHPLVRPRAHQTVARLDESGTIPSEPGNGCVIISKKTSAAPLPFAISHGTLIPMGFSSTLDDALSQSVEHAINMIAAMFEMPRQQVYLLLSAAINFNVTQVVDITPKAFTVSLICRCFNNYPTMNGRYAILETADGLPCGACLIGPAGSDKSLIGLAKELYKGME